MNICIYSSDLAVITGHNTFKDKNEITYKLREGTFTDDIEKMVRKNAKGKLDDVTLSIAVNKKYISKNMELKDGDEIALIPPVQGG